MSYYISLYDVLVIPSPAKQKTRSKSSYGTYDEVGRAESQELIWYEL